jgi:CRISPR/Cas system-associated exonuclease Cas4 (RecB family)
MSWSYSKLGAYEQCPAKKKYRYDDKVEVTVEKHPAAFRGTHMHDELEEHLGGEQLTMPDWIKPHQPYLEHLIRGEREIKLWLDPDWQPIEEEERDLVAILDVLVVDETTAQVVDYKSGKRYSSHVEQLELYCLATLCYYPDIERVEGRCYYLDEKPGSWGKPVFLDRSHIPAVSKRWDDRVTMMNVDTECAPRPGWLCKYCDYRKSGSGPCSFG